MTNPLTEMASAARRVFAMLLVLVLTTLPARGDLEEYVKRPDAAFAWKQTSNHTTAAGKVFTLDLTSQVWQGITWKHDLRIYEPPQEVAYPNTVLLFITGGHTGGTPGEDMNKIMFSLTRLAGARVALLSQVPNQPLLGGKSEDTLIAETFIRYLETKDENWPLLFPMAKSAVRAMDAVQAWAGAHDKPKVNNFVVTGASKRGWTTWLTGATDNRVIGIAPMVIVMLNMGLQGPNQIDVWGKYSEQIEDYVNRGLMERAQTDEGAKLWRMVDPYTYRQRLTIPKLLINGSNDRYWTLNALDLYWNGLEGAKHLVELPNAGHGLDVNRDWALNGLGAFFRNVVSGRPMPKFAWSVEGQSAKGSTLKITSEPPPISARLWSATSPTRDYRESKWTSSALPVGTTISAPLTKPESAGIAYFADLEYQVDGIPYHLTTTFIEPGIKAKNPEPARP